MRTKRKQQYIARDIYLGNGGLTIDGVHLPWHLTPEFDLDDESGGLNEVFGLTVTFFADRVVVEDPYDGSVLRDTVRERAREEAIAIVRAGLADVLEQLDEDCEEWQSSDEWLTDLGKTPHPTPPLARDGGERPKETDR